jgi:hypothetical protein
MAKLNLELRLARPGVNRLGHKQHRSLGEGRRRQARRYATETESSGKIISDDSAFSRSRSTSVMRTVSPSISICRSSVKR